MISTRARSRTAAASFTPSDSFMATFIAPEVPVFEIRAVAGMTDLLIRTRALGEALARTLGGSAVALMRGHGNVVVGSNLKYAVFRAYYTEVNARLQLQAQS